MNIVWDFLAVFYPEIEGGTAAIFRGIFLLLFVIFPALKFFTKDRVTISIMVFIIYICIQFPFVSDLRYSLNVSSKIFITLIMLPVGVAIINNYERINLLQKKLPLSYILILLGIFFTNVFDLGGYTYTAETRFQTGGIEDSWNIVTYLILLSPLYYYNEKSKWRKLFVALVMIVLMIILLISLKRVAIFGLVIGFGIFIYNYGHFTKGIKYLLLFSIVIILLSPIFIETLTIQYEFRKEKYDVNEYYKENRYVETFLIWEDVLSFQDPIRSIFGLEAFNSIGKYGNGMFGMRIAHIDFNLIVLTNGLLGLILYLNIYLQIYLKIKSIKYINIENKYNRLLRSVFWSIFLTSIFTSMVGQMYQITFRSIIFLFIGAILNQLIIIKRYSLPDKIKNQLMY